MSCAPFGILLLVRCFFIGQKRGRMWNCLAMQCACVQYLLPAAAEGENTRYDYIQGNYNCWRKQNGGKHSTGEIRMNNTAKHSICLLWTNPIDDVKAANKVEFYTAHAKVKKFVSLYVMLNNTSRKIKTN